MGKGGDSIKPPGALLQGLKGVPPCRVEQMTAVDSQTRSSWWIITVNNPSDSDVTVIQALPSFVRYCKGQQEVGENGTLHIQAVANTSQVRMSQMKGWLPRAHFETLKTKQHIANACNYVWKDDTAVAGTRFECGAIVERAKTFDDILYDIADWLVDNPERMYSIDKAELEAWVGLSYDQAIQNEFNRAANSMVKTDLALASTLVRPDLFRAWKMFRETFIEQVRLDRQTKVVVTAV